MASQARSVAFYCGVDPLSNHTCHLVGGLPFNKEKMSSSFGIKFCPLHPDFDESEDDLPGNLSYHPLQFKLMLSDMQVIKEQGWVWLSQGVIPLLSVVICRGCLRSRGVWDLQRIRLVS